MCSTRVLCIFTGNDTNHSGGNGVPNAARFLAVLCYTPCGPEVACCAIFVLLIPVGCPMNRHQTCGPDTSSLDTARRLSSGSDTRPYLQGFNEAHSEGALRRLTLRVRQPRHSASQQSCLILRYSSKVTQLLNISLSINALPYLSSYLPEHHTTHRCKDGCRGINPAARIA
jgi:hypothetical protein